MRGESKKYLAELAPPHAAAVLVEGLRHEARRAPQPRHPHHRIGTGSAAEAGLWALVLARAARSGAARTRHHAGDGVRQAALAAAAAAEEPRDHKAVAAGLEVSLALAGRLRLLPKLSNAL